MRLNDLNNFYHEWEIDSLPWDSVTPLPAGGKHPAELDQALVESITAFLVAELGPEASPARAATLAFLYLYMHLAKGDRRYVHHTAFWLALWSEGRSSLSTWAGSGPCQRARLSFFLSPAAGWDEPRFLHFSGGTVINFVFGLYIGLRSTLPHGPLSPLVLGWVPQRPSPPALQRRSS